MNLFFLGAKSKLSFFLNEKLKKNYKIKLISRSKQQGFIRTKIFNSKYVLEKWIKNIKEEDVIFIFSGLTNVIECEKNPNKYKFLNKCLKKNFFNYLNPKAKIVYFSSDYVFSNKKKIIKDNEKTNPINNYGKQKKEIEDYLIKKFPKSIILRLPKIFSKKNNDIFDLLNKNIIPEKVSLLVDQEMHFLEINEFLKIIKQLMKKINLIRGTYNLESEFFGSRYQLYKKYGKTKNFDLIKINQIKEVRLPTNIKFKTNLYKKI
jgi:dTDP-4-dehydrorhamnose reductase